MICPVCQVNRNLYIDILAIDTEGYCTTCDKYEDNVRRYYHEDIHSEV